MQATSKPDNSEIVHSDGGTLITGADAQLYFKAIHLKTFLGLYAKTGIIPTRGVGIKRMLALTAEITKPAKPYKTSAQDQQRALADITKWCAAMKAALPITDNRTK